MVLPVLALMEQVAGQVAAVEAEHALSERIAKEVVQSVSGVADKLDLTISIKLDLRSFLNLGKKAKTAVLIGCNRAAKPVREAVIANAQGMARTGYLARSIGTKSKVFRDGNFTTVIGPKMSFSRNAPGKITRGPRKGQARKVFPYLYANVLESPKSGKRFKSFLGPAWKSQGAGYLETVKDEIAKEIEKIS